MKSCPRRAWIGGSRARLFVALNRRSCGQLLPHLRNGRAGGVSRPKTWGKSVFGCPARMRPPLTPPFKGGKLGATKCGEICGTRIASFHQRTLTPLLKGGAWRYKMRGDLRDAKRAYSSARRRAEFRSCRLFIRHTDSRQRACKPGSFVYTYDLSGRMTSLTDPDDNMTSWTDRMPAAQDHLNLLAIETTCDETAAAVLQGPRPPALGVPRILSSVVASQVGLHGRYGGVVPEIASRAHVRQILPMIDEALRCAGVGPADLGAIAVATRPGLVGALVVGLTAAKTFALALRDSAHRGRSPRRSSLRMPARKSRPAGLSLCRVGDFGRSHQSFPLRGPD